MKMSSGEREPASMHTQDSQLSPRLPIFRLCLRRGEGER